MKTARPLPVPPAGLEPAVSAFGGRRPIHWATGAWLFACRYASCVPAGLLYGVENAAHPEGLIDLLLAVKAVRNQLEHLRAEAVETVAADQVVEQQVLRANAGLRGLGLDVIPVAIDVVVQPTVGDVVNLPDLTVGASVPFSEMIASDTAT